MKYRHITILFVFIYIIGSIISIPIGLIETSEATWWDSNWRYTKNLTISNPRESYQMNITVYKLDGYDNPSKRIVDCEGHCNDDFSDIRFIYNNNTLLDHWMEYSTSNYAVFWVNTSHSNITYFEMYYGNTAVLGTDISDGNSTFIQFSDEEWINNWTEDTTQSDGSWGRSFVQKVKGENSVKMSTPAPVASDEAYCWDTKSISRNCAVEFSVQRGESNTGLYIAGQDDTTWGAGDQGLMLTFYGDAKVKYYDGVYQEIASYNANTWYNISLRDIDFSSNTYDIYIDNFLESNDGGFRNNKNSMPYLEFFLNSQSSEMYLDVIRLREWADNPPAFTSIGLEFSNIVNPTILTQSSNFITSTSVSVTGNLSDDGGDGSNVFFQLFPKTEYYENNSATTWMDYKWNFTRPSWFTNITITHGVNTKDINNDGIHEIFYVTKWGPSNKPHGSQFCLNGSDGSIIWWKNYSVCTAESSHFPIQIDDYTNDGTYEFLYSSYPSGRGSTLLNCEDGSVVWNNTERLYATHYVIADVNRDGWKFIYQANNDDDELQKINASTGTTITTVDIEHCSNGGVSIADLNNDGKYEILCTDRAPSNDGGFTGTGLHCLDSDLNWLWNYTTLCSSACAIIADVNNNGTLEVIIWNQTYQYTQQMGLHILDYNGNQIQGHVNYGWRVHDTGAVHDLDGDGNLEVAVGFNSNSLIFDLVTMTDDKNITDHIISQPGDFANILGNHTGLEYYLIGGSNTTVYGSTYTKLLDLGTTGFGSIVNDFDGDNKSELIIWNNGTTPIQMYDLMVNASRPSIRTDMNFYNERRTGREEYIPPIGQEHHNDTRMSTTGLFYGNITGLEAGIAYKYMACGNNSAGSNNGSWRWFLTKPEVNSNFQITSGTTNLTLTWDKSLSTTKTYIERHTSSIWSRGGGTQIYNGTGNSYVDTGLNNETQYYYRMWSYDEDQSQNLWQYSDNNVYQTETTQAGVNLSGILLNEQTIMFLFMFLIFAGIIFSKNKMTIFVLTVSIIPLALYYMTVQSVYLDEVFMIIISSFVMILGFGKAFTFKEQQGK